MSSEVVVFQDGPPKPFEGSSMSVARPGEALGERPEAAAAVAEDGPGAMSCFECVCCPTRAKNCGICGRRRCHVSNLVFVAQLGQELGKRPEGRVQFSHTQLVYIFFQRKRLVKDQKLRKLWQKTVPAPCHALNLVFVA